MRSIRDTNDLSRMCRTLEERKKDHNSNHLYPVTIVEGRKVDIEGLCTVWSGKTGISTVQRAAKSISTFSKCICIFMWVV
mmetsp:Transcript_24208/g.57042  ORF Transcript_24208/g.57042 Transcript_24208/m.57042 type:complete len:80 (-) Transcript_24208:497-736(-)